MESLNGTESFCAFMVWLREFRIGSVAFVSVEFVVFGSVEFGSVVGDFTGGVTAGGIGDFTVGGVIVLDWLISPIWEGLMLPGNANTLLIKQIEIKQIIVIL